VNVGYQAERCDCGLSKLKHKENCQSEEGCGILQGTVLFPFTMGKKMLLVSGAENENVNTPGINQPKGGRHGKQPFKKQKLPTIYYAT
jgi:hypothetical protein